MRARERETHKRRPAGAEVTLNWLFDRVLPEPNSGCWIWMAAVSRRNGYGAIKVGPVTKRAHRVAYETANRVQVPRNVDVCHKCDIRCCINPEHLFLGTRADNMQDCAAKGRVFVPMLKGEQCPASKLTENDVRSIRKDARSQRQIAAAYGVDKGTIAHIKHGKTWRSVI